LYSVPTEEPEPGQVETAEMRRVDLYSRVNNAIENAGADQTPMVRISNKDRVIWRPAADLEKKLREHKWRIENPTNGSDAAELLANDAYVVEIKMADKPKHADATGDFYPYLLTKEAENGLLKCGIDLKRKQIFSETSIEETLKTNPSIVTKHCLWNCLQQLLPDKGERALVQLGLNTVAGVPAKKRVLAKIAKLYAINIRLHVTSKDGSLHVRTYKGSDDENVEIKIGLISGHFFPNDTYSPAYLGEPADINGLIAVRELGGPRHDDLVRGNKRFRQRGGATFSTANLLKKLQDAGYTRPFPSELAQRLGLARTVSALKGRNPFIEELLIPDPPSENTDKRVGLAENVDDGVEVKDASIKRSKEELSVFYADFETFVSENGRHVPYLACAVVRGGELMFCVGNPRVVKTGADESLGKSLLDKICKNAKTKNIRIYFHNLRYDVNFLYDAGLKMMNTIEDNSHLYQLQGVFLADVSYKISIRDTCSYLPCKLAEFPKMFGGRNGEKWTGFPYDLFTKTTLSSIRSPIETFTAAELERVPERYKTKGWVEMYRFAVDYCSQGVRVLQEGFDRFRQIALETMGIDVDGPMTAASYSVAYLEKEGALNGVETLDGTVRAYVQESVVVGRVCVRGNEPIHYVADKEDRDTHLVEIDAVSLYPSAMVSIPGLPTGHPTRFEGAPPDLDDSDGKFYVATVRLRSIARELHMSTLSAKGVDGVRNWGKGCVKAGDVLILNRIQIDSARRHQGAVFEFVGGLRWSKGYNTKISGTLKNIFEWRLRLKAERNPLENTVKLMMNTICGKFGQPPLDEKIRWIYADENKALSVAANAGTDFVYLESANRGRTFWKLKYTTPDFKHSNRAHCASLILAQSKSNMYQVTTPLDDDILHTDTGSFIVPRGALSKLNRPDLIGERMGQFHTELAWSGDEGKGGEVTANEARILAKNTYVLQLENPLVPGSHQFIFRAENIPNAAIIAMCHKKGITPLALYKEICEDGVTFDLVSLGLICFKQHPTAVVTMKDFQRRLGPFAVRKEKDKRDNPEGLTSDEEEETVDILT
jgi:hypothetical protein